MAARPYWQGQIRLALVSIPVQVFTATKSGARVQFRQIHEPSGKPIKYEKVVPGIGPVDPDDIAKGYEYTKGSYVLFEDEELDAVKLETKKTLTLTQFVDYDDIAPIYFEKPYYVVPADDLADEAFIVLRESLRRAKKVGLGQITIRGREYVVSLKACGRGILMETIRYADEVNKADGYFRDIPNDKPDEDLLDLASTLIAKKTGAFDPNAFTDHYADALKELIERKKKAKGGKVTPDEDDDKPSRGGSNVIDLMAALKKSIEKPGAESAPVKRKAHAKKPAGKRAA
ncbi:MAG: Ku protein [Sphingomonadaceae bacterium]|nr:Ku protein [Sphingomonadaceae bacterium]